MSQQFLNVQEAADFIRVSKATLYGWVHQRKIPFRKHGSKLLFNSAELLAWSQATSTTMDLTWQFEKGPGYGNDALGQQGIQRSLKTKQQKQRGLP